MTKNSFKNKRVTVMGLGLHGGGVASVNWLVKHGAIVTVTDLKSAKELESSLKKIKNLKACRLVLGKHQTSDFKNADLIVQNPGVPKNSQYLKIASKFGVLIENEASLFFKNCPAKIIGITGTRGKSTTSTLIYKMLQQSNLKKVAKVWLAGLPQQPMMAILDKIKKNDLVVLELSSWQLEVLGNQKLSPQIAVVTNIYPDHLNRYSGMNEYIEAKKNIFKFQTKIDFTILNFDNLATKKMGGQVLGQRFWFSKKFFADQNGSFIKNDYIYFRRNGKTVKLINKNATKLKGEHNLENILAAVLVAEIFKVSGSQIKIALNNFLGLPGRIELIKKIKGVEYINDTTATTPDGTMAALKALLPKKIILIAGGTSKNIPNFKYQALAEVIKKNCQAIILLPGLGSDQILKSLKQIGFKKILIKAPDMPKAVRIAASLAKKDDVVLLSPACASFNLFINEYDRGDQFVTAVSKLAKVTGQN
ncbi:MAG: UDP-N-acetylmuramoyl-L-alanine--D-glutamate ligase [Candidatus Buchananbacteria bacterium]